MRLSIVVLLTLLFFSCNEESNEIVDLRTDEEKVHIPEYSSEDVDVKESAEENTTSPTKKTSTISYQIIENEYGYGYQIYDGNNLMINQPHIPAVQGMKGFESREKAEIVAKYVVSEIDNGNFPPTVSEKILRDLGAL